MWDDVYREVWSRQEPTGGPVFTKGDGALLCPERAQSGFGFEKDHSGCNVEDGF